MGQVGGGRADVGAVIPAYQAAATVADVVKGTRAQCAHVVVVDDGSTDGTELRARAAGAQVVRLATNSGKGAAILAGLRALESTGVRRALTLDADGQHLPGQIPLLLAASDAVPGAIVVGVRNKEGKPIARLNRFGNWIADRLMRAIAGQPLPDTQSGFRVYPIAATVALGTRGTRYDFETEVLLRASRQGIPLLGVPVEVYYPPVAERVSHYQPWQDTLRIIRTVVRVLLGGS